MTSIDLGVYTSDSYSLESFIDMALQLGLSGVAEKGANNPFTRLDSGFSVLKRVDVSGRGLTTIKKSVIKMRKSTMILAVPLTSIEVANWAAEDNRVDLLTINPAKNHRLRESTARLAASNGTHLEIQFAPLLDSIGLNRSKMIKTYREAIGVAIDVGMPIVISSGAKHPLQLRSSFAMRHVAMLLGMDSKYAEMVICKTPFGILERNTKKLGPDFVASGIEIVAGENDEKDP